MKPIVALMTLTTVLGPATTAQSQEEAMAPDMKITSPSFRHNAPIPPRFTADGADLSPELNISGVPEATVSLALIVDDPDAPRGTWVHWVVWNLPPDARIIPEGGLPAGAVQGRNSWGRVGYGGPSPPSGTHRYYFKLYALDIALDLPASTDKAGLLMAMEAHVLGRAELMGTYAR